MAIAVDELNRYASLAGGLMEAIKRQEAAATNLQDYAVLQATGNPFIPRVVELLDGYITALNTEEPLAYLIVAEGLRKYGKDIEESEFEKFVKGENKEKIKAYLEKQDWGLKDEKLKERWVNFLTEEFTEKAQKGDLIVRIYLGRAAKEEGLMVETKNKIIEETRNLFDELVEKAPSSDQEDKMKEYLKKVQTLAETYMELFNAFKTLEKIEKKG